MSKAAFFIKQDMTEWREIGVFYDIDNINKNWFFFSSKNGIKIFIDKMIAYSDDSKNSGISDHEHLGPYQFFKLITWNEPIIDKQGIYGSLKDISRIAGIISDEIKNAHVDDEILIDKQYSDNNNYKLNIKVMPDDFDPASLDKAHS
jgi:hypothetical protein